MLTAVRLSRRWEIFSGNWQTCVLASLADDEDDGDDVHKEDDDDRVEGVGRNYANQYVDQNS